MSHIDTVQQWLAQNNYDIAYISNYKQLPTSPALKVIRSNGPSPSSFSRIMNHLFLLLRLKSALLRKLDGNIRFMDTLITKIHMR